MEIRPAVKKKKFLKPIFLYDHKEIKTQDLAHNIHAWLYPLGFLYHCNSRRIEMPNLWVNSKTMLGKNDGATVFRSPATQGSPSGTVRTKKFTGPETYLNLSEMALSHFCLCSFLQYWRVADSELQGYSSVVSKFMTTQGYVKLLKVWSDHFSSLSLK